MTITEARRYFGSNYAIADALGIHRSAVGRWKTRVPAERVDELRVVITRRGLTPQFSGRKRK